MKAEVAWAGDVSFRITSGSGHTVVTDGPEDAGGTNAGPRPMELVLMGVGGCASYDVVLILKRSRQDVTDCVCQLTAERADDAPKVFTRVAMHFVVTGRDLDPKKVERAVHLSAEKYCSASIMLGRGGTQIEHTFEVVEAD